MNKSNKWFFLLPLTSFSKEVLSFSQNHRSDINNLRSSTNNRFEVSALIPTLPSNSKSLLAALVFSMFFVPIANATNYYVSTSGSDSNPGTLSSPWKTITKAANTLVAGDTVNIRAGTYKEQVTPKNSGYAGAFITYAAYPGETVTVDASNGLNWAWNGVFDLTNRSYLQISGLQIFNSPGFGIFMSGATNMRILNNHTYKTFYSGIYAGVGSGSLLIDGNQVELANTGASQESITIDTADSVTVSHNIVHNGQMEGIDFRASTNSSIFGNVVYDMARVGIYIDNYNNVTSNINIYNNMVYGSKAANSGSSEDGILLGAEEGGTAGNVNIYNNILYNIAQSGIRLNTWTNPGFSAPKFSNVSMYNNTIYNTGLQDGGGIQVDGSQNTGIIIRNNIFSKAKSFNIQASSGTTISNNQFDGGSTSGTAAITGSPLFVSVTNNDFHLQSTSAAINAGTSTGAPTIDFDLNARPQGGQVDIGAFEYGSSTTPPNGSSTTPPNGSSTTSDTTAPSAPANLAATAPDSSKANLSWSASTDNVGVTGYKIYRDGTEIGSSATTSYTDASIVGGTTYNYTVKAYDGVGNLSASSNTATVNTPKASATVNISSYSVQNITGKSANIKWSTDVSSTGTVSYGTSASNLGSQVAAGSRATSQSVQLNGLTRRTTYYYQISVTNGSAVTLSPIASFRTARW